MIDIASLLPAILAGGVSGLMAWGGIHVELRWLRREIKRAHERIDYLERRHAPVFPPL